MPNTLDLTFTIVNDTLMPYSRTSLLLAIQRTIIGEYSQMLVPSKQPLNKDTKALVHSSYDIDSLYIQFRLGKQGQNGLSPDQLVAMGKECKSKLENAYKLTITAAGQLGPCSDEVKVIEF